MYEYDPSVNVSASAADLIIGGEVVMFGEYIDDANIQSIVYPRYSKYVCHSHRLSQVQ